MKGRGSWRSWRLNARAGARGAQAGSAKRNKRSELTRAGAAKAKGPNCRSPTRARRRRLGRRCVRRGRGGESASIDQSMLELGGCRTGDSSRFRYSLGMATFGPMARGTIDQWRPLSVFDSELQTLGCRHSTPDICRNNATPDKCAFVRADGICILPPRSWPRIFAEVSRRETRGA